MLMGKKSRTKEDRRRAESATSVETVEPSRFALPSWWRSWFLEAGLLLLILVVIALRVPGLLVDELYPNWDAFGHFLAAHQMAEYLSAGQLSGYYQEWLGGLSLFQFYPPLYYMVVAGIWLLTGNVFTLEIIFRASLLLTAWLPALSLWAFTRQLVGRAAGRWALGLSLAFVFYPSVNSLYGIGSGAVLWSGLVPSVLGLSLAFLWLAALDRHRERPSSLGWLVTSALLGAAVVLTHTLSWLFVSLLFVLWLLGHRLRLKAVRSGLVSAGFSLGLAAFWLVPFLTDLSITSGSVRGQTPATWLNLQVLFPLNIPYLEPAAVIIGLLALLGTVWLVRERQWPLLSLWLGSIVFFLARGLVAGLVPDIGLHYHRFLAFVYFLMIVVSSAGLAWIWTSWADGTRRRQGYLLLLVVWLAGSYLLTFDFYAKEAGSEDQLRRPIPLSEADYPLIPEADQLVAALAEVPDVVRIAYEQPMVAAMTQLGTLVHLGVKLPLRNSQAVTGGLFMEAAPEAPFLQTVLKTIEPTHSYLWGDERLRLVKSFVEQPLSLQLARLRTFGISHYITMTRQMAERLQAEPSATPILAFDTFAVFRFEGASAALVQPIVEPPVLYLSHYGLPFRDVGQILFSGESSYQRTVIDEPATIGQLLEAEAPLEYAAVIVDGTDIGIGELNALTLLERPVAVFNAGADVVQTAEPGLTFIERLEMIPRNARQPYEDFPAGWRELQRFVDELPGGGAFMEAEVVMPTISVKQFNNEAIEFVSASRVPVAIALGYSPRWERLDGERVYRASPDRLLVMAEAGEPVRLRFNTNRSGGGLAKGISATTLAVFLGWIVYQRRRTRLDE
jgi:hypothetical protein